ncbi:peptidylprolyl isomerase [Mycolicibacterium thermoresistibile]
MPTNEQRRAAAKRKLERQLARREARARRQRLLGIIGAAVVVVAVVAAAVFFFVLNPDDSDPDTTAAQDTTGATDGAADVPAGAPAPLATGGPGQLPTFDPPANLGADCQYPAAAPASKPVDPPRTGQVPTEPALISASMATNQGNLGLWLDNGKAPCTVNSFASLAQQGYFDDTPCHRLTTGPALSVLQCGDPTGMGTGGPGYQFDNEYPTNQYQFDDPALQQPVTYPRGTLAMANAGPNTNGSQFFLVYQDSQLPPNYTVFGTIDETGLETLDKIAAAGVAGGGGDGAPATDVQVTSILLD